MKYILTTLFALCVASAAFSQQTPADTTRKNTEPVMEGKPLFVVDAKETAEKDIALINPENILSIEVLKGTDATDRYGDKGRNGVVLITMKVGEKEKEKGKVKETGKSPAKP